MIENIDPLDPLWKIANEAALREDMVGVLEAWKNLAENGVWSICAKIGSFYEIGRIGVEKDFQQALKWYRKAIFECDDPEAHVGIGRMYYLGNGVEKNVISACEHWKKAFAKHSPDAALYLGIVNYSGLGIKRDVKQAKAYLQYAADNKYFYAFGKLARIAFDENRYINGTKLLIKGFILGRKLSKANPADPRLLGIE